MSHTSADLNLRPDPDAELAAIARYVCDGPELSALAYDTARWGLLDSLACAFLALEFPACAKLLGPVVPGTLVPHGARVPGTGYILDPVKAAFDIGACIRWLDFNDTWLAAEWGHPSDNLGAILAVADYLDQTGTPLTVRDVLTAMIQAHEIQGVLALANSFNRVGLDHVVLVKVASTAVVTRLLGGSEAQVVDALSQAFVDGQSLRTYRHAPNTVSRKSWAAGDACRRAVTLAQVTLAGERGLPSVLSAPKWGFADVLFGGCPLQIARPFGSYVMENILFKIAFPAEFHAQTAVEAALTLHPRVVGRLDEIERVELRTQEPAVRIISKTGPLHNEADRDHCLQYMVAVPLICGALTAECYEDEFAADPRIDALRERMTVVEEPDFTRDYYDPDKRAIGNSVQVFFRDGSCTERVSVEYPVGHRRRREEGWPLLERKFRAATVQRFGEQAERVTALADAGAQLDDLPVAEFMARLAL